MAQSSPEEAPPTFPAVSLEDWTAKAAPEGGPVSTPLEDGLDVPWLFTPADALAPDPGGLPGQAPFVRGTRVGTPWDLRQEHAAPDREQANKAILDDLEGGATAITLRLDEAGRDGLADDDAELPGARGVDGIIVTGLDDLDAVLHDVLLDLAPVALDAGAQAIPASALLAALWERRGHEDIAGSFRIDPLGALAEGGTLAGSPEDALANAAAVAKQTDASFPKARALAVDTRSYVGAGASAAQELALALASGVAHLRACDAAGLEPARAARQIEFTLQVGADQFLEIAKLRAARRVWARVLEASGVPAEARRSPLYARTSVRAYSALDPWVNILRGTTATFAAAVGGADGISVSPFDLARTTDGTPHPLARRIARNTQLVLQEESALARVGDPAGGSWYVEWLTNELAQTAWARFQAIEAEGGILAALRSGMVANAVAESTAERQTEIAHRTRELTGVNAFPLLDDDKVPAADAPDLEGLAQLEAARSAERPGRTPEVVGADLLALTELATAGASLAELAQAVGAPVRRAVPFALVRDGRAFERLRDLAAKAEQPPRALLACLGPISAHVNVATWTRAFFETGGIAGVPSEPLPDADAVKAAYEADPTPLAVVVAGPKEEDEAVAAAVQALTDAGAPYVYVAGRTVDGAETVKRGVDAVDTLTRALARCGADQEAVA